MKINRLRLLGFKSFVEPTDLLIETGLTGVVGPNGCGKSNLLEALRWVMGETSHKSMRAAAMDDVIFSGTTARPARNSAEVTIFIDNSERKAPAEFNDHDVIEITRRIEREAGSNYRINGREARQRDVKILFEDAATGARSPALVRQGQIAELVNAKPESRRRVLEDAAGIAGLHSRRHEAELRLNATEANLARLNDVMGGLATQIESLKRQARQARRYKELSGEVRRTEALMMHLGWAEAQALVEGEEAALLEALSKLGAATEAEAKSLRLEAELADAMPPLREEEAKRGAILARLKSAFEAFEREAERAAERERELRARADQARLDIERENALATEARDTITRLDAELAALTTAEAGSDSQAESAARALREVESILAAEEARAADLAHKAAESRARRASLTASLTERRDAVAKVERQLQALAAQTREISGRAPDASKLAATTAAGQELAREIGEIEAETLDAEHRVQALAGLAKAQREASEKARLALKALDTEGATLTKLLMIPREGDHPPVLDQLTVSPGYEAALAAALGDDLDAPIADDAPVHWRKLDPSAEDGRLPAEAEPLGMHVRAPHELARRLAQIGVIARELGARLQMHLKPGQRLVSREGDLWRWDGFVAAAHGMTPAAQRLAERNRLASIYEQQREEREAAERLAVAERESAEALAEAEMEERSLRQNWRAKQTALTAARDALNQIERQARETESKMAAVTEARERAEDELVTLNERLAETEAAFEALGAFDEVEAQLAGAQSAAAARRAEVAEARAQVAGLERERRMRGERLVTCQSDHDRWTARIGSAAKHIAGLAARLTDLERELHAQAEVPALIAEKRQKLLDELSVAERERQAAADRLVEAEGALKAAQQALRAAQNAVSSEREARARAEAKLEGARQRRQEEARRIREMFEVAPDDCLKLAEAKVGEPLPSLQDVDRTLTRLKADRERLGGVNLQADEELTAISEQLAGMERERADVDQAIGKLRGAIQQLNREGKKRLQEAFDTVNGHFQRLFTTLFSGGEARLEMVESEEDPLEGGLEIIAKPPGKKPVTLSLLSGGEQTLTALSLIFAVFLTNPSPICVLDEVDAPLDDANVDRFCTLMEKMADETATRFLVITHHPMTMARMNRLFGVTMAERGISQLVSVDLQTARAFREAS